MKPPIMFSSIIFLTSTFLPVRSFAFSRTFVFNASVSATAVVTVATSTPLDWSNN